MTPRNSDTPRISEAQDPRITGSQRQLDSEEFLLTRITGRTGSSQIALEIFIWREASVRT